MFVCVFCVYRFVRVEYQPCHSMDNLVETFTAEAQREKGNQFVEGLMFSLHSGVVMTANMCTTAEPGKVMSVRKGR